GQVRRAHGEGVRRGGQGQDQRPEDRPARSRAPFLPHGPSIARRAGRARSPGGHRPPRDGSAAQPGTSATNACCPGGPIGLRRAGLDQEGDGLTVPAATRSACWTANLKPGGHGPWPTTTYGDASTISKVAGSVAQRATQASTLERRFLYESSLPKM